MQLNSHQKAQSHSVVQLLSRTNKKLTIRFDVSDTGIGIPAKEIERIFEPFHQADNSLGRSYFGSGLGLTISNDLVKSMGGTISVKSTPGVGSIFSFVLTLSDQACNCPNMITINLICRKFLLPC
jgi:signal transduction histidine kinase